MKIAYVVNNAAFFVSHRLAIANAAKGRGDDVVLITGSAGSASMESKAFDHLSQHGIRHIICPIATSSLNPLSEAYGLFRLTKELRREKPDIIHCVSPKGILYGGLASKFVPAKGIVFAISGMGFLFTSSKQAVRDVLRTFYLVVAKFAYNHPNKRVIVQNSEDHELVSKAGIAADREVEVIPGSGVDLEAYKDINDDVRKNIVLLPARLLRDKGVIEFLEAAAALKRKGTDWTFIIAGAGDYQNPSSIPRALVSDYEEKGVVDWLGYMEDIRPLYAMAKIVCLPSYREGMPKCLLEAAAAGCAVITTDVPGCRDAIIPGVTGDLVPARSSSQLAAALEKLMSNPERISTYGANGRLLATSKFDLTSVVTRNLAIYDELLRNVS